MPALSADVATIATATVVEEETPAMILCADTHAYQFVIPFYLEGENYLGGNSRKGLIFLMLDGREPPQEENKGK